MPEPAGDTCRRCGLRDTEAHVNAGECIDALRSLIARLQFRVEKHTQQASDPAASALPSRRGGPRDRRDARMVVLDGERITLTEAGRRLGISAAALHFRILRRTRNPEYQDVDVRAVGAGGTRTPADVQGREHE